MFFFISFWLNEYLRIDLVSGKWECSGVATVTVCDCEWGLKNSLIKRIIDKKDVYIKKSIFTWSWKHWDWAVCSIFKGNA